MGTFTRLEPAELDRLATVFSLGTPTGCTPIAAGTINSNYRVDTARGPWFLRINEGKTEDDVAWEARLVTALAAAGVPTPAPVVAADGRAYAPLATAEGKWVSAFPWRAGRHVAARDVTPSIATTLGRALGQLHDAGLAVPVAWRRPSIYDHDHLVARFAGIAGRQDAALARAIEVLGDELSVLSAAADVRARASSGLIHGDLFTDNVLWSDGQLVALLDFEQASGGSLPYDLAVCLNDWCWDDGPRLDVAAALVAGYQAIRPLGPADRAALLIEVRAAAARFTITRITDVYLARVDQPEKDFRAFLARVEAWRGEALGQLASVL